VASGIHEVRRAHAPWPVPRTTDRRHAAPSQFPTHLVHVIHPDAQLKARAGVTAGNDSGFNELLRILDTQQIDDHVPEPDRD